MVRDAAQGYGGETEGFGLENLIWHHPSPVIQCLHHCKSQVFCPRTRSQRVGGPSHEFSKVDWSYCPLPCRSVAGSESSGLFFLGGGVNEACWLHVAAIDVSVILSDLKWPDNCACSTLSSGHKFHFRFVKCSIVIQLNSWNLYAIICHAPHGRQARSTFQVV